MTILSACKMIEYPSYFFLCTDITFTLLRGSVFFHLQSTSVYEMPGYWSHRIENCSIGWESIEDKTLRRVGIKVSESKRTSKRNAKYSSLAATIFVLTSALLQDPKKDSDSMNISYINSFIARNNTLFTTGESIMVWHRNKNLGMVNVNWRQARCWQGQCETGRHSYSSNS